MVENFAVVACLHHPTSYYRVMRRTDPISFRIKAEIKQALERLAKADRRSLSQYIELALEDHVEAKMRQGKKPKTRN